MRIKEAYLKQVPAKPTPQRPYDDEMENCDGDLTRAKKKKRASKPTIQRKWVEKETFDWGLSQQQSFDAVKQAITTNAMSGADPDLQYYLALDASQTGVGGCLFQLQGIKLGTEATPKFLPNKRIIIFLSFKLQDA